MAWSGCKARAPECHHTRNGHASRPRYGPTWPTAFNRPPEPIRLSINRVAWRFCLSDDEFEQRAALLHRMHNESGDIGTRMLTREDVRAMVPGIGDEVTGASFCPLDGHASPLHLLRALHQTLDYRPNRKVNRIDPRPGLFTVHAGEDIFIAPKLVIAAGLGSRDLAPLVGLHMPVAPLQGQIIVTERLGKLIDYPTHLLRQTAEGTVMLGDSQEDVGFDIATKVAVLQKIAERNTRIFPALKDASIVRMWAALRVMSPDGFPIYEQSERYPGRVCSDVPQRGDTGWRACPGTGAGHIAGRIARNPNGVLRQAFRGTVAAGRGRGYGVFTLPVYSQHAPTLCFASNLIGQTVAVWLILLWAALSAHRAATRRFQRFMPAARCAPPALRSGSTADRC